MKTSTLFMVGLVSMIVGLLVIRHDHNIATQKVLAIVQVDQTNAVPTQQMTALQHYVSVHMGSSVEFRLNGAYARDLAAAQAAGASGPNGSVYQQAQAACASIKVATQQAQCNEQYLTSHLQSANIPSPIPIPQLANYTYNLTSPLWTPDWAGFFIATSIVFLLTVGFRLIRRN